ncbi:hypothetical protein K438DRAFT_1614081, partial [Mycena galopus ATCC 62051]
TDILPNKNGFFYAALTAYNKHHALIIRPDDVWLTILCQFNFFVNAHAETLRASFVQHEGKQALLVESPLAKPLDFGSMSRQMTDVIDKNIADPTLRAWALPTFTTTTANDTTVAAVLLMATLKPYFAYRFAQTGCGIPRVTLEGEKADWVDILGRLEKLKEYGVETIAWYHLLRPVIARFVAAFDEPDSEENVDFWSKIVHHHRGSGYSYYSGWMVAFGVFKDRGKWLGHALDTTVVSEISPEEMSAETFWATYAKPEMRTDLVYDGTPYHRLSSNHAPPGFTEVEVTLVEDDEETECLMVAGVVGARVSSSGDTVLSEGGKDDTLRPVAGWWMFEKKTDG